MKRQCPRVVDFWIVDVARRLGRSEGYVQGLYSVHGTVKRPGAAAGSSPSRASGSNNNSHSKSAVGARRDTIVVVEESEAEEEDYNFESDEGEVQPKRKATTSTRDSNRRESGIMHGASKNVLDPQRKENECKALIYFISILSFSDIVTIVIPVLKLRAETAENNFIALVGRVQDFRTSLRSEIRAMPNAVDFDGLSKLSAAMETTIDDAGLYLRTISDALNQSRANWGINYGTQPEGDKVAKEAGSKGSRPSTSARKIRQRSPEADDRNTMQKRRKI